MSPQEYAYRFKNEQAISYQQVENCLMCSPQTKLTWDTIIDLLLNVNQLQMNRNDNYVSEYNQGSEDNETNSCKMSGVSKFDNSSILSGGVIKNKYEAHQQKMKSFINIQSRTHGHNTVANTHLNSLNISKRESLKDGAETFGKQNSPE